MRQLFFAVALVLVLVACEKTQTAPSARKPDAKVWSASQNPFVAPGWKEGDEASWESQIRERAAWQNEYSRVSGRQ